MTTAVWNWLPDNALVVPETLGAIDTALDAWSRRWFQSWRIVRQRLQFASPPTGSPIVAAAASLSVRANESAVDAMMARALDIDLTRLELTEADRTVTAELRELLLQDLAGTLQALLPAPDTLEATNTSGFVLIDLADEEGRKLASIETCRAALARLRWKSLKPAARSRTPLSPLRTAIGDVAIELEAKLGSANLPLADARKLAVGDVIVLDQTLDTSLTLSGPDGSAVACARLVDTASPRSLQLEAVSGNQN